MLHNKHSQYMYFQLVTEQQEPWSVQASLPGQPFHGPKAVALKG